jgi:Single-strand binding protein family
MSFSVNHVMLEGNLGQDIKGEFPDDGDTTIAKFTVAQFVGAKHKTSGKYTPRWWNIRLRSKTTTEGNSPAEWAIANLKKGDAVVVEGRISGWIPDEEYEKEVRDSGYKAAPVLFIDAISVRKLLKEVTAGEGKSANREEMPPF